MQNTRLDFDRPTPVAPKPRKMSTGGNRSWSEEEEAYLIQTRMQKMPYKHIAAHLKKTELACRLHYHQLSHGSHRRRRTSTSTTSSTSSNGSRPSITQYALPGFDHNGFQTNHNQNPYQPLDTYGHMGQNNGRMQHKILLPKPPTLTPDTSPDRYQGLRIDTHPQQHTLAPNPVDADRLHAIYNSHRGNFWSAIANEYGSDISPTHLEDTWKHNPAAARLGRPPTPGDSPNSKQMQNMNKTTPFPDFNHYEQPRAYGSMGNLFTNSYGNDRLPYPMVSAQTHTYDSMAQLPRLDRQPSWSNQSGPSATSISTLLNDDKHSRQPDFNLGRGYSGH